MTKKVLMFSSLIVLISSFLLINRLQVKNFTVFNNVNSKQIEEVKASLSKVEELGFTALLCNEIRVPFDDQTNTFFVPLDMEETQWEKMTFVSGQPEYQILFQDDVTDVNKQELIASNKKIELIVFDGQFWAEYYVTFTGLPIVDLSTNEGFYAAEEITGTAVFFDTNFTLHGTEQSAYNGHIRGNTSRMFPKKGYKLNLTYINEYGEEDNNKLSLFGMRKDDDWILQALYNDDTKIRDRLSMEVWDKIGANVVSDDSYYGPKMTYVEVFADNQYCGLYGLMEPVDGKQLNLAEEDYSYKRKNPGSVRYKYEVFSNVDNVYGEVEGFEIKDGLMEEDAWKAMAKLSKTITSEKWRERLEENNILNEDSVLRMWIFIQIITGHDHTAKNMYYVAKYDENLKDDYQFYFVPWDMDLTWGNVSVGEINPYYTAFEMETLDNRVYWDIADMLIDDNYHDVKDRAQDLYNELRENELTNDVIDQMILQLDHELRDSGAFARDKERWPEGIHATDSSVLRKYAKERLNYLDIAINDFDYFEE